VLGAVPLYFLVEFLKRKLVAKSTTSGSSKKSSSICILYIGFSNELPLAAKKGQVLYVFIDWLQEGAVCYRGLQCVAASGSSLLNPMYKIHIGLDFFLQKIKLPGRSWFADGSRGRDHNSSPTGGEARVMSTVMTQESL